MKIKTIFDSTKCFWTSDSHWGHENIVGYSNRLKGIFPSGNKNYLTLLEMEEVMIKHWNETVPIDGIVFHLGDFFFMCTPTRAKEIFSQLNGTIYWIKGNHDTSKIIEALGQTTYDILEIKVTDDEIEEGHREIIMSHYPLLTWGKWSKFHLFGHCHGSLKHPNKGAIDVGVDTKHERFIPTEAIPFNSRPYSYQEILTIITKRYLDEE